MKVGAISKILVANRGEIAVRIVRTCHEQGIATVAVHSEVDGAALHVRLADEAVCIGPAPARQSYLNIPAIIAAAEITGADAVHPGYGFLSENAEFAEICEQCGLKFIGPTPENIRQWGDKVAARNLARRLGLSLLQGTGVLKGPEDAVEQARKVGFPVILKARAGGGGRGMKVVRTAAEIPQAFGQGTREAEAAFKDGSLYIERYVEEPRHIEFQVLSDGKGEVYVLGERECSIQRRHQKLIEEAPSIAVSEELRADIGSSLRRAMRDSGYVSAGTLEFLMDEKGSLSFMEMNTRIQVEHPVTEAVLGIDLVAEQIRLASGLPARLPDRPLKPRGHALECRINAEDPKTFAPSPGLVSEYHPPGGHGVRVDSGVYAGWKVPPHYDSLLMKVITHGPTRTEAVARMKRALSETILTGVRSNVELHQRIMSHEDFLSGRLSTRFLERL